LISAYGKNSLFIDGKRTEEVSEKYAISDSAGKNLKNDTLPNSKSL